MKFYSEKLFSGFSTCFRQWRAEGTHCKYLHGYAVSFKVTFEGSLDYKNWVFDFGGMKRAKNLIMGMNPNDYFKWLLDHTVLIAEDDPHLETFKELAINQVVQLRVMPQVGCERLAEHLFIVINDFLKLETDGRVKATKIEVFENGNNSAGIYQNQ